MKGKIPLPIRKKGIRMDTEKRLAKRVDFLRKSIYISCGNINEAMNTLSCRSLYEAINKNKSQMWLLFYINCIR